MDNTHGRRVALKIGCNITDPAVKTVGISTTQNNVVGNQSGLTLLNLEMIYENFYRQDE